MYGTSLAEKLTNAIQNVKILTYHPKRHDHDVAKMGFKTGAGNVKPVCLEF
jgi:hypothetical protein